MNRSRQFRNDLISRKRSYFFVFLNVFSNTTFEAKHVSQYLNQPFPKFNIETLLILYRQYLHCYNVKQMNIMIYKKVIGDVKELLTVTTVAKSGAKGNPLRLAGCFKKHWPQKALFENGKFPMLPPDFRFSTFVERLVSGDINTDEGEVFNEFRMSMKGAYIWQIQGTPKTKSRNEVVDEGEVLEDGAIKSIKTVKDPETIKREKEVKIVVSKLPSVPTDTSLHMGLRSTIVTNLLNMNMIESLTINKKRVTEYILKGLADSGSDEHPDRSLNALFLRERGQQYQTEEDRNEFDDNPYTSDDEENIPKDTPLDDSQTPASKQPRVIVHSQANPTQNKENSSTEEEESSTQSDGSSKKRKANENQDDEHEVAKKPKRKKDDDDDDEPYEPDASTGSGGEGKIGKGSNQQSRGGKVRKQQPKRNAKTKGSKTNDVNEPADAQSENENLDVTGDLESFFPFMLGTSGLGAFDLSAACDGAADEFEDLPDGMVMEDSDDEPDENDVGRCIDEHGSSTGSTGSKPVGTKDARMDLPTGQSFILRVRRDANQAAV